MKLSYILILSISITTTFTFSQSSSNNIIKKLSTSEHPLQNPYDSFPNEVIRFPELKLVFEDKGLSKYDIRELFNLMDVNLDNAIDREEWDKFYRLFLRSYIACKPDAEFEIPVKAARKCFGSEDWLAHVRRSFLKFKGLDDRFRRLHPDKAENVKADPLSYMFELMDRNANGSINLSEYVFARRVSFVFRKCTYGDQMNFTAVQCGMNLLSDGSRITSDDARNVLRNSIQLFSLRSTTLSFLSFYKVANYYRIFNSMCRPVSYCTLEVSQIMKAIENQNINLNLDTDSLLTWMKLAEKQTLDFINFMKMSFYYDIFFTHSNGQGRVNQADFNKIFLDPKTPRGFKKTILSFKNNMDMKYYQKNLKLVFTFTDIKKASMMRFKQVSFVQSATKSQSRYPMDSLLDLDNSIGNGAGSDYRMLQQDSSNGAVKMDTETEKNETERTQDDMDPRLRLEQEKRANAEQEEKEFQKRVEKEAAAVNKPQKIAQQNTLFRIYDFDLDGYLDFREFVQLVRLYDVYGFLVNATYFNTEDRLDREKFYQRWPLMEKYKYLNQPERENIHEVMVMLRNAPMNFKHFSILMTLRWSLNHLQTNSYTEDNLTLVGITMMVKRYDLKLPEPKKVLALYRTSEGYLNVNTYRGFDLMSALVELDQIANYYLKLDNTKDDILKNLDNANKEANKQ